MSNTGSKVRADRKYRCFPSGSHEAPKSEKVPSVTGRTRRELVSRMRMAVVRRVADAWYANHRPSGDHESPPNSLSARSTTADRPVSMSTRINSCRWLATPTRLATGDVARSDTSPRSTSMRRGSTGPSGAAGWCTSMAS